MRDVILCRDNDVVSVPPSFTLKIVKYIDSNVDSISLVDIGANRGAFYDEIKNCFLNAKIRALLIEPIPECITFLRNKFAGNTDVKIAQYAVSNTIEQRDFFINQFDETSSLLKIKNDLKELNTIDTRERYSIKLITNTLDNVVVEQDFSLSAIDLLKIDVQGTEDLVLLGAKKTLKRTKYIWIEVSFKSLYNGSCLFNEIHSILLQSDYILIEIVDGHRSSTNELLQANCLYQNINPVE